MASFFSGLTILKTFSLRHSSKIWEILELPTPVLLPEKFHGRKSLVGCSPWGREESDTTEWLHFHALEKEMATHSSVLAWRIPGMAEPGGLLSMGSHRVGHDWSDLAAAAELPITSFKVVFLQLESAWRLLSLIGKVGASIHCHYVNIHSRQLTLRVQACWLARWIQQPQSHSEIRVLDCKDSYKN